MIDSLVEFLRNNILIIHLIGFILVLAKFALSFNTKSFRGVEVIFTFFRFFSKHEMERTSSRRNLNFMTWSNVINVAVYLWLFLTIILLLAVGKAY